LTVNLIWDATAMAGITDEPGELVGSGALIPARTMRELFGYAEIRRMLIDPSTGHLLDLSPHRYRPSAALAEYVALRDATPTTPTGAPTPAGSGDLDHLIDHADGGPTTRTNLHTPTRRWHRVKTTGGFTATRNPDGSITWTSTRTGRTYTVQPHDYRNDP
jgi:hypothetical protein